ncbi:MAG: HAD hydrolase-like protein [Acidobacteria bacterium]|nr:HAD hydrolase-like protein [Acidobacteriota bacterium]
MKALIFDVDGTLAETERDGHLPACNEAFAILGYPVQWTWTEFKGMLSIPGNGLRMRRALEKLSPAPDPAEIDEAVDRLVRLKRRLYTEKYVARLPLRPGVAPLIREAMERHVRLAIVSTSDEDQIHALLKHRLEFAAGCFAPVLGKGAGQKTASDSPLFKRCLAEMGTPPAETLAVEDSAIGLRAARVAGVPCAVIYNEYTFGEGFAGAALVARSLEYFNLERLGEACLGAV